MNTERIRTHDANDGTQQWMAVLPIGTRIRSKKHPELTGYIKAHEYYESGALSPTPYLIGWDDDERAARVLGWLFIYARETGVEKAPDDH